MSDGNMDLDYLNRGISGEGFTEEESTTEEESEEEVEEEESDDESSSDGSSVGLSCERELVAERNSFGWTRICFGGYIKKEDEYDKVRPFNYEDLDLSEEEKGGWLSPRMVAAGLSNLRQLPNSSEYALTKLQLPNKGIKDISTLEDYPKLIYVDLSKNKISNLEPLETLTYIMFLDLSSNRITYLDPFPSPLFLTDLNLSHNNISELIDFSPCWSLRRLNLSSNQIECVYGLKNLRYLVSLDLSDNNLEEVSDLDHTNLKELNLSDNCIVDWTGDEIVTNTSLTNLDISRNQLSSLKLFKDSYSLRTLNISFNNFVDILELDYLKNLKIVDLNIEGNEVSEFEEARRFIIHTVPSLVVLNNKPVTAVERLFASHLYSISLYKRAYYNYLFLLAKQHTLGPNRQGVDLTIRNFNPGIVVLVGPPGCMKQGIIKKICTKYPKYVRNCYFYATQNKLSGNPDDSWSYFKFVTVQEFDNMLNAGKFIVHEYKRGYSFGLSWEELVYDGRVCLLGLELPTALTLKWLGFQVTLILTLTQDNDLHKARLNKMYRKSEQVIKGSDSTMKEGVSDGVSKILKNPEVDVQKLLYFNKEEADSGATTDNDNCEYSDYHFALSDKSTPENSKQIFEEDVYIGSTFEVGPPKEWFGNQELLDRLKSMKGGTTSVDNQDSREGSICPCRHPTEQASVHVTYKGDEMNKATSHYQFLLHSACKSKEEYREIHEQMPGLFKVAISTDDTESASAKVTKIIKEVYEGIQGSRAEVPKVFYDVESDPLYDKIVGAHLEEAMDEIVFQQTSSGLKNQKKKQLLASILEKEIDGSMGLE